MDSVPTSIPEHSVNMVHFGGIVCHGHESPTLHLFLSSDRSDVRRHRCPAPELGCTIGLCISPVSHHPPSDPQTQAERALQPDSFTQFRPQRVWFPDFLSSQWRFQCCCLQNRLLRQPHFNHLHRNLHDFAQLPGETSASSEASRTLCGTDSTGYLLQKEIYEAELSA